MQIVHHVCHYSFFLCSRRALRAQHALKLADEILDRLAEEVIQLVNVRDRERWGGISSNCNVVGLDYITLAMLWTTEFNQESSHLAKKSRTGSISGDLSIHRHFGQICGQQDLLHGSLV